MLSCLVILTGIFFLLTLYSIIQANTELLHIQPSGWLALKILDTSSAATLFVTIIGALLLRHQFALSVLPRINYKAAKSERQDKRNPNEFVETWRVELRNTGLGSAIVNRAEYFIDKKDNQNASNNYSFDEFVQALAKNDLVRDRDYWIEKIGSGFSLSPKDECRVFEIKIEYSQLYQNLRMDLYFQGQLSDKYIRQILLTSSL